MAVVPGFRRANGRFSLARAFEFDQVFVVLRENFVVQRDFLPGTCKVEEKPAHFPVLGFLRQQRAFGGTCPSFLDDVWHDPSRKAPYGKIPEARQSSGGTASCEQLRVFSVKRSLLRSQTRLSLCCGLEFSPAICWK